MEDNQLLGQGQAESSSFPDGLQEGDEEVEDQGTGMATVTVSAASPVTAVVEVEDEARSPPPLGIQVQTCMEADEFTTGFQSSEEADEETNKSKSSSFATPESCCPLSSNSNSEHESSPEPQGQRFQELQAFLKLCDEADQRELLEALRSLSAAARSGHAFNLEYRALMLSIEEGKEMLRLKMLNVMGKGKSPPPAPEPGATPVGVRLPAPGSVTDLGEDARLQQE